MPKKKSMPKKSMPAIIIGIAKKAPVAKSSVGMPKMKKSKTKGY